MVVSGGYVTEAESGVSVRFKKKTRSNQLTYIHALDGLRCFAVLLVMMEHWLGELNVLPLGPLGVDMFFVLSGFLITRILLFSKEQLTGQPNGLRTYLKNFYIRRTLRIFPVFYVTLFFLALLDIPRVRETLVWNGLYVINIFMAYNKTWLGRIDHFWSLAVEEQVYLILPLLLFFTPRTRIPMLVLILASVSLAMRFWAYSVPVPPMVAYISTPSCLDAFALGTLLAYLYMYRPATFQRLFGNRLWLVLVLAAYCATQWLMMSMAAVREVFPVLGGRLFNALLCFLIIGNSVFEVRGFWKWLLQNSVVQYLGRISYGIYLFHSLVYNAFYPNQEFFFMNYWKQLTTSVPGITDLILLKLVYCFAITVALASLSWFVLERPIICLKSRFA